MVLSVQGWELLEEQLGLAVHGHCLGTWGMVLTGCTRALWHSRPVQGWWQGGVVFYSEFCMKGEKLFCSQFLSIIFDTVI